MKVKIIGQAIVVTSKIKLAALQEYAKLGNPSVKLFDEKDKEVYAVSAGNVQSFTPFGVVFAAANTEGDAILTFQGNASTAPEDRADEFAIANTAKLEALKKYEHAVTIRIDAAIAAHAAVKETFEVLD